MAAVSVSDPIKFGSLCVREIPISSRCGNSPAGQPPHSDATVYQLAKIVLRFLRPRFGGVDLTLYC
jgi:hypothetical protein